MYNLELPIRLIYMKFTRIATEASFSLEYVIYADKEGPLGPLGLYILVLLTTILLIFPYYPKYESVFKIFEV